MSVFFLSMKVLGVFLFLLDEYSFMNPGERRHYTSQPLDQNRSECSSLAFFVDERCHLQGGNSRGNEVVQGNIKGQGPTIDMSKFLRGMSEQLQKVLSS